MLFTVKAIFTEENHQTSWKGRKCSFFVAISFLSLCFAAVNNIWLDPT
jgi:hypothetical protein